MEEMKKRTKRQEMKKKREEIKKNGPRVVVDVVCASLISEKKTKSTAQCVELDVD